MKKIKFLILLLPLLSGCYNYRELNELGITTAVSIDYQDDNFYVIASVINPTKQQDASSANSSPFVSYENKSNSLQEAFRGIVLESPRQLYASQLEVIVITEDIINNHLEEFLEFFSREPEIRTEVKIIIAKNDESIKGITLQTLLTNFSSSNILQSLEVQSEVLGITYEVTLNELLNMYLDPNLEVTLPSMTLYGNSNIGDEKDNMMSSIQKATVKVGTTMITKENKVIGYLDEDESKVVSLINDKLNETILNFPYKDGYIVFEPNKIKTELKANVKKKKITLDISGYTKIKGFQADDDIKSKDKIKDINKFFNNELEKLVLNTFTNIRNDYGTDIFGFRELFYRTDYKYFNNYCDNWYEDIFPNIELKVNSNIKLYEKGNTLGGLKYEK